MVRAAPAVAFLLMVVGTSVLAPSIRTTLGAEQLPAFPGAVGQGAASTGGRGGDVYHVTNLRDYDSKKGHSKIAGSLRHALRSATGPRTVVFDVGGAIELAGPLEILKNHLTIAGQTSPSGAVTLWGYPVEVSGASDIIVRFVRIRVGDFHVRRTGSPRLSDGVRGNSDLDPGRANGVHIGNGCQRVIFDHVSVVWGIDETFSVTNSRDVTVQHSIIAESLNDSFHPKGEHGYGSLLRGDLSPEDQRAAVGGYTFYGNLWAHHKARNPSLGGKQFLAPGQVESERRRTDVNLVNNVVYDWGDQPTHRSNLGEVRVNLVGNYYVNGPASRARHIFNEKNAARTMVYARDNYRDFDQNGIHDGARVDPGADQARAFRGFGASDLLIGAATGSPFGCFHSVEKWVRPADEAYDRVLRSAGASLVRDAVDRRVIDTLVHRTGGLIDSQEEFRDACGRMPGIDDLPFVGRPADFDTDGDGMSNPFELEHGLDPGNPADRNQKNLSELGYTNLEVYLNSLAAE